MDTTKFKVEDIFGEVISQDSILTEQITQKFFRQNNVIINIKINFNFFKPKKKNILIINRVLLLIMNKFC